MQFPPHQHFLEIGFIRCINCYRHLYDLEILKNKRLQRSDFNSVQNNNLYFWWNKYSRVKIFKV